MISRTLARLLAVGAFALICAGSASAQQEKCSSIVLPNGDTLHCDVVNGQKVYDDANGTVYKDSPGRAADLGRRRGEVATQIAAAEALWLEKSSALEAAGG